MHSRFVVMRYEHEDDPKKPHPVHVHRKGDNALESDEHGPREVGPLRRDSDLDRHRHVRC